MPFGHRSRGRPYRARRGFIRLLWMQPIWAVPFALFFWALFSSWTWSGFATSYLISLVFAYSIGYAIWALECLILPRLGPPAYRGGRLPLAAEIASYAVAAMLGGYLAAVLNHLFVLPGFLGNARAFVYTGVFTILFVTLFSGVGYAIVFYRESVERARAAETARAELAQAELRALRAQINPHFLFNTLNSIAALIAENPAAAEDTTTGLAEIFRYALRSSEREHATLGEELAFLRDYLAIEQIRLGDRLHFETAIEPGLEGTRVPSLLLQPIVENAVKYGVAARPEGGSIALSARRVPAGVAVEVVDDGPGLQSGVAASGTGFGLHSVRERLRAAGLRDALVIEPGPERGTRVRLTLPVLDGPESTPPQGANP